MRKLLLVFVFTALNCLLLTVNCKAQIVTIPDANFKTTLLADTTINTNKDTEIQVSEANAFAGVINVGNKSIADLTGIETFTNLTALYCGNNQLTSLNITANTALTTLQCGNNQLISLNVSANTALTQLFCALNQLTTLNVSTNTALTTLACQSNQLISLNVSANTALTYLLCNNNQLTSLNMKNGNNSNLTNNFSATSNPALTCIQVDNATYMNTNFGSTTYKDTTAGYSTDCSCTVNIPDANFRNYLLNNGSINTNTDGIISCSEATAFTGTINVDNKSIADLTGIEAFTALTYLSCSTNQLTSLNVSANTALISLGCNNNQLTSLNVSGCTALNTLVCYSNQLTSLDVSTNTGLSNLQCHLNQLTGLNVAANTALTYLACGNNQLTSLDVSANTALTSLDCSTNQLASLNLPVGATLTQLWCGSNQLTSLNVSTNTALTYLNCSSNQLTSIDVTANSNLASLDCNSNYGITTLLTSNPVLTYLNCSSGAIPSIDISADTALTSFNCNYNSLTSLNVSANTALTTLTCTYNQLTGLNVSSNTALTTLGLEFNQITSLNLSNNLALQVLDCSNNGPLASMDVSANTVLTTLLCNGTQMTNLNVRNGNNTNLTTFNATGNPNLTCIMVDDTAYSNANWAGAKDAGANYNLICCVTTFTNNPKSICAGNSYTFNTHTYTTQGNYNDTLQSVAGCDSIIVTQLTVNATPVAGFTTSATTLCLNDSLHFTDTSTGAINYQWKLNGGNYDNTPNIDMKVLGAGSFTMMLVVDNNVCSDSSSVIINVNPLPNVSAGNDISLCQGDSTIINGNDFANSFSWSPTVGLENTTVVNPMVIADTTISYILTVTNSGCANSDTVLVTVIPLPIVSAGPDRYVCQSGGSTTLIGQNSSIGSLSTFFWSPGSTLSDSTSIAPFASPTVATAYVLTSTTTTLGCISRDTVLVSIVDSAVITGNVTYQLGAITHANVLLFNADSSGAIPPVKTTLVDTSGNYMFSNLPNGNYKIQVVPDTAFYHATLMKTYYATSFLWDSAGVLYASCGGNTADIYAVYIAPLSPTGASISGYILADPNYTGKTDIQGDPIPGVDVSIEQVPQGIIVGSTQTDGTGLYHFTNMPVGNFLILATIPGYGLDSTRTVSITSNTTMVIQQNYFVSDSTIYPTETLPNSIKQIKVNNSQISVFPNPAQNRLELSYPSDVSTVEIYNGLGQMVYKQDVAVSKLSLDISSFNAGVYQIKFIGKNFNANKKFVKID